MRHKFSIEIDWELLEAGLAEERAAYGAIGIRIDNHWLTEAQDAFVNRVREKVHLSGYQLAQWLAWNWWRLRWEPEKSSVDWALAHRMTTIGGGYVWPNVECATDGRFMTIRAHPTPSRAAEPLRYLAEVHVSFGMPEFESAVEMFVEQVLEQLRTEEVRESNLKRIWGDLSEERRNGESAWYRRLEATMGYDPDEAPRQVIDALIEDGTTLGEEAVAELAANASRAQPAPRREALRSIATACGYETDLASIPSVIHVGPSVGLGAQAWEVGEAAARALRIRENLGDGPLSDEALAALAGTSQAILTPDSERAPFSFALSDHGTTTKLILHSPIPTNRRFALARLVGDLVCHTRREALVPALRAFTYRQKVQRAFAAELLCPFEEARNRLDDDLSDENQERVAADYRVSPILVRTQLVNKKLLGHDVLIYP